MKHIVTALGMSLLSSAAFAADAIVEETPILTVEERAFVFEANIWGGQIWRDGNAITSSEEDELPLLGGGLLAGIPIGDQWLVQIELSGEKAWYDNDQDSDTYDNSVQGGGHLAWTDGSYLFGAFGGVGRAEATDEYGNYYLAGVEGKVNFTNASLALQAGYIRVFGHDDGEMFDKAPFVRGIGQVFFNDGRTMLQGDLAYAQGTQDFDSSSSAQDDLDIYSWGLELEHAPNIQFASGTLSLFAAYEGLHLVEDSDGSGADKITDHTLRAGIKFRFGASTPFDRERATAPDLPNVGRWQGATPALD